jgi:hypothetical protein
MVVQVVVLVAVVIRAVLEVLAIHHQRRYLKEVTAVKEV